MITSVEWKNNRVCILDQRLLPREEKVVEFITFEEVAQSIEKMMIRGAPAIGVAAALGIALGVTGIDENKKTSEIETIFSAICERFKKTRPTAVNLFWAIKKMRKIFDRHKKNLRELKKECVKEALKIREQDIKINRSIGKIGSDLFKKGDNILTHCNTGGLATAGYGTALGVIRKVFSLYGDILIFATETRPFLQGARLTAWELTKEKIPFKLVTDSMAGYLMKSGKIDSVIVGADRIAGNGDTANKIGTYTIAVLAHFHKIPFYVAAPLSTVDLDTKNGNEINIEERDQSEVLSIGGVSIAPEGTSVLNPAFDVTPASLITGIITESKIIYNNFRIEFEKLKF